MTDTPTQDDPHLRWIGRNAPRVEDDVLLRGGATFLDDIAMPGALEATFVRSPVAHGRIRGMSLEAARALSGVHAVLTFADLRPTLTCDRIPLALPAGGLRFDVDPPCLAIGEVCYVGEPVVLILATSRRIAEDAAALVELDIETLIPVVDPVAGLELGSPKARLDTPDNLVARTKVDYGDIDGAFAGAAHVHHETFHLNKGGGHPMEPRGVLARYDDLEDRLTVWDSTQMPHRAKAMLVASLGLTEHQVRVVTPEVGGGFGTKAVFHPEELAIPAASLLLKRPIKWVEDRFESFTASIGERDQVWSVEAAFEADGRLRGIRGLLRYDHGAATPYGIALPFNAATNLIGPYVLPAYRMDIDLCLTNKTPAAPTRGAGRPQGTFVMERLLDRAAAALGIGRDEIRRRNMIAPAQMPYTIPVKQRDGSMMVYDSGDYPQCQSKALEVAGWLDFPARQAQARAEGRFIGLGLANYVEATGRGPFESVGISIGPSGKVVVTSGATAQGQGVKTMLAQVVADVLGLDPTAIHVVVGDTAATASGLGAYASRQAVTAGNAAFAAATLLVDKARKAAAELLEASEADVEIHNGMLQVKGVPGHGRSLTQIARALAGTPGFALPGNLPPGLSAASDFMTSGLSYTNGCHLAEVEVDPETGGVKLNRYVVVHDCGRMINPMMVEGQILGGVVHGIGMTLFEWMRYDAEGQPLTVTFADYLLPTSDVVPRIEIHHLESPTPLNPLGIKGAAESGTIGAPSAIVSGIEDALRHLDIRIDTLPLTPPQLRRHVRASSHDGARA
ncbi:MAG: carbon monoxide dehydrogenase large subunit [Hyphomicrobiales bacterium]|nr:carbon monoxide dehydrogenase large subunit [Hyphomicrobiales bacterium]